MNKIASLPALPALLSVNTLTQPSPTLRELRPIIFDCSPLSTLCSLQPMHHFFLSPDHFKTDTIHFPDDIARQMARVLRLQPGQHVLALDGTGNAYEVELLQVGREGVQGRVVAQRPAGGEARARITLYLALTGREKFEWMLQKCTEVGAAEFVPVISSRSLVQDERDAAKKLERWERIVREAAEQSRRGMLPQVHQPLRFDAALSGPKPTPAPDPVGR
jgi:16S rRNA (uracil1498-N3)-methyltransferase